jgi:peroxidase
LLLSFFNSHSQNLGRDHGLPTFLEARRQCGFAEINSFDELSSILPPFNVDLLRNVYDSVQDIDLYVGGALESFMTMNQVLVGPTFGCIIGEQYRHTMGGDAYFFTHKTNPYPFTQEQLDAIDEFSVNNLICTTSGLQSVQFAWAYLESAANVQVPCQMFKPLNLTAWQGI